MASTSDPLVRKGFKYDVFLSFRGEDTRKSFVDHLYHAFEQKGIETYMDDKKIEQGKPINDQLIKSIEDSRFYIIVFSKTYASSSWCLDELVKIMESQNTGEHTSYPVFLDVEPTQVRKQTGSVGEAFSKHEKEEASGKWRGAMKEAAGLAGWDLKEAANGSESKLIQIIVDHIFKKLCSISLNVDKNLVGMKMRIEHVCSSLEISADNVRMIGIKGMGGAGKTTLARALYDQLSTHFDFEGTTFVENVRKVSKDPMFGLTKLQEQILRDVFNNQKISLRSVSGGKNTMMQMMHRKKVLVVLDDVDHIDQLEELAGDLNWFKSRSRIIITTRDEQVLVSHGVKLIHDVNLLTDKEAICLFSRYAFRTYIPIQGYEDMSGQVISYASGLPLTIKVLGSFLCGKIEREWIDALERLKKIPLKETFEILELSYNALEDDYKEMFLDIACILKGEHRDKAVRVLESCGFHASIGIRVLEQKSLITISPSGILSMHDHLEEMGRNIVFRLHPDEHNRHSRLWIGKDIKYILANNLGNEAIRCIQMSPLKLDFETVMRGLRNMKKLRVLYMSPRLHWKYDSQVSQRFPNTLQYLSWTFYPFPSLHTTFQADNLVGLDMSHSSIIFFWEEGKKEVFNKLRFLDLSYTKLVTLNLGPTLNLEMLDLEGCTDLIELHLPPALQKLKYLALNNSKLKNLNLGWTPSLETLCLAGCKDLEELQMPFRCPKLKSLILDGSKVKSLDLRLIPNLETLGLKGCRLVELHMLYECPKIRFLDLCHSKLRTLHLGLASNLERLDLKGCLYLVEINAPVGCLKKLVYLNLSGCWRFESFLFEKQLRSPNVSSLTELYLIADSIGICPLHTNNNMPKFRFTCFYKEGLPLLTGNLEKLISFGLCACTNFESFSRSICSLQCLRKLTLQGRIPEAPIDLDQLVCLEELNLLHSLIRHLPDSVCMLKQLKSLKLQDCQLLEKLPKDFGQLKCLEELKLSNTKIKHLPDSVCMLKQLKSLKLQDCPYLEKLPGDFGQLESLEELILSSTNIKHLPNSVCMLKQLKSLEIVSCWLLDKLPDDLGRLEGLEKLVLKDCRILQVLPRSLCKMKSLISLHLISCLKVKKLPEELGRLGCLKELDITSTLISHLPWSVFYLKGLRIVGSRRMLESFGFTSEIQTSNGEPFVNVTGSHRMMLLYRDPKKLFIIILLLWFFLGTLYYIEQY